MSKIILGTSAGVNVHIDLDVLLRTRMLVQANSGGGKSWLLRRLAEQLFGKVPVIIIDPEGEFSSLREKFGFVLVGKGGETPASTRSAAIVAHKLLELRASAVCDIFEMKVHERHAWVRLFLEAMIDAPKNLWRPCVVIVDEAHTYMPEKGAGESEASEAMIGMATRGRKRGFCTILATQRLGKLRKDGAAELLNILIGPTFIDVDRERAAEALGVPKADKAKFFHDLKVADCGRFWALGRAISKDLVLVKVGNVQTTHPEAGSAKQSAEPPPPPEKIKALLPKLADLPKLAEEKAKTEADLRTEIRSLTAQLAAAKSTRPPAPVVKIQPQVVQVPFLKDVELGRMERIVDRIVEPMTRFGAQLLELKDIFQKAKARADEILAHNKAAPLPPPPARIGSGVVKMTGSLVPVQAASPMIVNPNAPAAEEADQVCVSSPQRRILKALVEFWALGRNQVPRSWIAAMSGQSNKSSGYDNNLSNLKSRGFIERLPGKLLQITETGRDLVGMVAAPSSTEEMLLRCLRIMSEPQGRILRAVHQAYPNALPREEVARMAGQSPTSSGFDNNISALASAGMIERKPDRSIKCAGWLYFEIEIA